jgi:hypothetical protein
MLQYGIDIEAKVHRIDATDGFVVYHPKGTRDIEVYQAHQIGLTYFEWDRALSWMTQNPKTKPF